MNSQEIKEVFVESKEELFKSRPDIQDYVRMDLASELGVFFEDLVNNKNTLTVYKTVIKIRSSENDCLKEFRNSSRKPLDEIIKQLLSGEPPTIDFQKAILLVMYIMKENHNVIEWAPKDSLDKERLARENLEKKINELRCLNDTKPLKIIMFGKTYEVLGIEKVQGNCKADFVFTYEGGDLIYVSHKYGKSVNHFQQYSGVHKFKDNPFVKETIENVRKRTGGKLSPGDAYAIPIPDRYENLSNQALFGIEYSKNNTKWSKENIHMFIQGDINLEPCKKENSEDVYEITSSGQIIYNPNLTSGKLKIPDGYEPTMFFYYSKNRGILEGFNDTRIAIWPRGSRRVKKSIQDRFYDERITENPLIE